MKTTEIINLVISIIGCTTGLVGFVFSIFTIKRNRTIAVHEFLSKMESDSFISARKKVYGKTYSQYCNIEDEDASKVINIFHHWGLLAKKHYLPMWVFDGASGNGACRLYEKTENYIKRRREVHNDDHYAEYFEWLYNRLKASRSTD